MEEIVEEGTNKTTTGNWMTDRSKVETLLGEGQSENPLFVEAVAGYAARTAGGISR